MNMKPIYFSFFFVCFSNMIAAQHIGIGTTKPDSTAAFEIKSSQGGFLPPRMDSNARNAIERPAIGLTIYNSSINAFQCYNGENWYSTVHFVGEKYGGGTIFFIYDNGQHGLIAAPSDYDSAVIWNNGPYRHTGATGDGLNGGEMNTAIIVAAQIGDNQTGIFAAKVCAHHSVNEDGIPYGDWYLPTKYELGLLYQNRALIPGLSADKYWSSTEIGHGGAWLQNFDSGGRGTGDKKNPHLIRPVRQF